MLSEPTTEYEFYNIGDIKKMVVPMNAQLPGQIMNFNFWLYEYEVLHEREIYNILDLVGDLGGIQGFFVLLVGIFIFPISEYSYNVKALEKLYLVDSKDTDMIFIKEDYKKKPKTNKVKIPNELATSSIARQV